MRIGGRISLIACLVIAHAACSGAGGLFRQYEYEEDVYLSLDGSATVYVNCSIAALDVLRGTSFDVSPAARVDRTAVREFYSSAHTRVARISSTRRSNRRFVHLRLDVDDIRLLNRAAPFAWSSYRFGPSGSEYEYRQEIGASANHDVGRVGWNGRELVAFRLHLPSKITWQNSGGSVRRGNIIVWEQPLAARQRGEPIVLNARMQTESILYRTLWLFAATFAAVAAAFAAVIWWMMSRPVRGSHHADTV